MTIFVCLICYRELVDITRDQLQSMPSNYLPFWIYIFDTITRFSFRYVFIVMIPSKSCVDTLRPKLYNLFKHSISQNNPFSQFSAQTRAKNWSWNFPHTKGRFSFFSLDQTIVHDIWIRSIIWEYIIHYKCICTCMCVPPPAPPRQTALGGFALIFPSYDVRYGIVYTHILYKPRGVSDNILHI